MFLLVTSKSLLGSASKKQNLFKLLDYYIQPLIIKVYCKYYHFALSFSREVTGEMVMFLDQKDF